MLPIIIVSLWIDLASKRLVEYGLPFVFGFLWNISTESRVPSVGFPVELKFLFIALYLKNFGIACSFAGLGRGFLWKRPRPAAAANFGDLFIFLRKGVGALPDVVAIGLDEC